MQKLSVNNQNMEYKQTQLPMDDSVNHECIEMWLMIDELLHIHLSKLQQAITNNDSLEFNIVDKGY